MNGTLTVESPLGVAIGKAVQQKCFENGWSSSEDDRILSNYIVMLLADGKDMQGVKAELPDLLGFPEDDPANTEFVTWLFQTLPDIVAKFNETSAPEQVTHGQEQAAVAQDTPSFSDAQMDDAGSGPADVPSGPKAMRSSGARGGRAGRMLGHMSKQMDRSADPSDGLRRIKGAASGGAGRIDSHAGRAPRGPRNQNLQHGVNRMMNGRGGGMMAGNPMMNQAMNPNMQFQLMQLMEQSAAMMSQIFNGPTGAMPGTNMPQNTGKSLFDRVDKRGGRGGRGSRDGARGNGHNGIQRDVSDSISHGQMGGTEVEMSDSGMATRKDPFDTLCKFNLKCTVPTCPFAHQSPAAPANTTVDLTDRCFYGAACENTKCSAKHPSPSQRRAHLKDEVDCKFYPNCTNPHCPFKHPDVPPCRNGADCKVEGCKFIHSKIMCRYNPCLNPSCPYKHAEGQKRGQFEDKVWTAAKSSGEGFDRNAALKHDTKAERFAGLNEGGQDEELILPGMGEADAPAETATDQEVKIST